MKKASILWCSLLFTALLAAHSADAVGQLGGYVRGGKIKAGTSMSKKIIRHHYSSNSAKIRNCEGESCHGAQALEKPYHERRSEEFEKGVVSVVLFLLAILLSYVITEGLSAQNTTLMMVQVAVKNRTPEIQSKFSQIAETLTRLEEDGLDWRESICILSATKKHILIQSERCFSATASVVDVIKDKSIWEERFEQVCNEQLGKSDGRDAEQIVGRQDEYVVVTVLVASYGVQKLPAVNCLADLENAFSFLESLTDYLAAVKVFWTPSDGTSKILANELIEEFQQLKRLEVQGRKPRYVPRCTRWRGRLRQAYMPTS